MGTQSLHADLTVYDRIRVTFAGISQGAQFVPEAWSGSNSTLWSCGLGKSLVGETVDVPLANGGINTGSGANFAAIDGLWGRQRGGTLCFLAKPAAVPARPPNPSAAAMSAITEDMLNWLKRASPHFLTASAAWRRNRPTTTLFVKQTT